MIKVKISTPSRILVVCATQIEAYKEGSDLVIDLYAAEGNRRVCVRACTIDDAAVLDTVFEKLNKWTYRAFDSLYVGSSKVSNNDGTYRVTDVQGDSLTFRSGDVVIISGGVTEEHLRIGRGKGKRLSSVDYGGSYEIKVIPFMKTSDYLVYPTLVRPYPLEFVPCTSAAPFVVPTTTVSGAVSDSGVTYEGKQ